MISMETSSSSQVSAATVPPAQGSVEYDKLPALNPDSLKAPAGPKKHIPAKYSEPIDVKEVINEMSEKLRESIMTSSLSGIMQVMRVSNIVVAGLMIAIAIAEIISVESFWSAIQKVFSVFYTFMFALILIGYELRTAQIDAYLRENFGFMYGPKGRCLFLCLISIFPLGMVGIYGVLVTLAGFCNAYFNYFVITKHPSFTRGIPDYEPPVSGASNNVPTTASDRNNIEESKSSL